MSDDAVDAAVVDGGRTRVKRLFEFLRALDERRNPIPVHIRDQRWSLQLTDLPEHSTVRLSRGGELQQDSDSVWFLRVARPALTNPPAPPQILDGWLKDGWAAWGASVETVEKRDFVLLDGLVTLQSFEDDLDRVKAFEEFLVIHGRWRHAESPARRAHDLFERLYGLWET